MSAHSPIAAPDQSLSHSLLAACAAGLVSRDNAQTAIRLARAAASDPDNQFVRNCLATFVLSLEGQDARNIAAIQHIARTVLGKISADQRADFISRDATDLLAAAERSANREAVSCP